MCIRDRAKDAYGEYKIPVVRQRPLLLMGAPGIGKTAIMEKRDTAHSSIKEIEARTAELSLSLIHI